MLRSGDPGASLFPAEAAARHHELSTEEFERLETISTLPVTSPSRDQSQDRQPIGAAPATARQPEVSMPLTAIQDPFRLLRPAPARRHRSLVAALAVVVLASAGAGSPAGAAVEAPAAPQPVADMLRFLWAGARANLLASARVVEPRHYDHRPLPELRSFGELVAHVADTQYFFCSAARSEPNPNEPHHRANVVAPESLEARLEGKEEIVAAAERAVAYCDPVFESAADATLGELLVVGMPGQTRIRPLLLGLHHMARHYGNMTIYLRELGYVPPSSATPREPEASR
jgi:uncharacterized damage-inducible protein DinB